MRMRVGLTALALALAVCFTIPAWADSFSFSTGSPDGKLGALSRPAGSQGLETETADDFVMTQPTVISSATLHGLFIPAGTPVSSLTRVEVEIYHVFPLDSDTARVANVPTRTNSPSDVEIDTASRDSSESTLTFNATQISTFTVANTVINGIHNAPGQLTHGEGSATGEQVGIDITFNPPLFLPAGHYFFRPEAEVSGGDFLFLSAPRPITAGTPFPAGTTDLQAWIRNANLAPDWLRIGADIIGGVTFNMTFSLTGNTVPGAGTPGEPNCHGKTVSAMAQGFGGIDASASTLGYSSVDALQGGIRVFCGQ